MRQVATSTDRFLAFARRTSGKIGEDPNDVLATSDAEMESAQRELEKFRKQLFERTTAFTTGAARDLFAAALKSISLKFEFGAGGEAGGAGPLHKQLVVVNQSLKESVEKLTDSSENRAFFQTSVQLQQFLEAHPESLRPEGARARTRPQAAAGDARGGAHAGAWAARVAVARAQPAAAA